LIALAVGINIALFSFLIITLINVLTGPYLSKKIPLQDIPLVSVFVPARNEERNIEGCLRSLLIQDYPNLEIIVLDDESSDKTKEIIEQLVRESPKVNLVEGKPLPPGWTGKNWACHQLSKYGKGKILIFTDSDNRYAENAVTNTVARMQKYQLDLLSAFPQQITVSFFEKLVVPVIDLLLYNFLILWLTYHSKFPSLAAANGQWIAFRADSYRKLGGHSVVRDKIVEDVELSRACKRKNLKILTCAGTGIIYGRMYQSTKEVWHGFSKNLFGLLSYRTVPFFMILMVFIVCFIAPFIFVFSKGLFTLSLIAITQNLFLRLVLALVYKHPPMISILLHPFSIITIILIALDSYYKTKRGTHRWKNRELKYPLLKIK
jgi:chlorobactene glucosyltransferase